VECYYYAPIYLCRNFGIAILPTLFADYGHRQVFLLTVLLLVFGFLQAWLQPWRGFIPNFIDASTTSCLIMTLLGAAFLFDVNVDTLTEDLRLCFIVIFCLALCCFVVPMTFLMYRRFVPRKKYAAFLCHHKGGCAVGARLVKLELEHRLKASIFLDSDELDNLEDLLDIVRCATGHLVVLLTQQTLSRPWCAGEVATAYANDVSTICVAFDDYKEFTQEDLSLKAIESRWSAEAFAPCVSQGVSLEIVLKAFSKLASMDKISYPRVAACLNDDPSATLAALDQMCAACSSKTFLRTVTRTPVRQNRVPETTKMDLVVLASNTDAEAISTAGVVAHMVRLQAQWNTSEVLRTRDVESCARPRSICVVLTEGCLTSEGFARTLHMAEQAWSDAELVTVRGERFAFPTPDVLATTVSLISRATSIDKVSFENLYKKVLSVLSLPFTPSGHKNVLEVEIRGIVSKVNRLRSQPRKRAITPGPEDDEEWSGEVSL